MNDGNLISCVQYLQYVRTTVVKISSFFMLLNKNEMGVSDISVSRCISMP